MFKRVLVAIVGLMLSCSMAYAASKADAQQMVEKAATYLKENGKDKFIAEVNKKDGQFSKGDLYVYVTDLNYNMLAHPVNPQLIGKNNVAEPDADGKMYRKEIVDIAKTKGNGWIDYKAKNPTSGKVEEKMANVLKQDDVIIVAGVYKQ